MQKYRVDLHIHTTLSPCGSLEMSPETIIRKAKEQNIDLIGITDHNSMRQCNEIVALGKENGLAVLKGVEISSFEEVHCLAFFENDDEQNEFQKYLDEKLPNYPNHPLKFGDQVWVNRNNEIIGEEKRYLVSGLNASIGDIAAKIKEHNGIFIPAHIDRSMFSMTSQLGFIDATLPFDALELSKNCDCRSFLNRHPVVKQYTVISSSDAHFPEMIGNSPSIFEMESLSFAEIKLALRGIDGRRAYPEKLNIRETE